jgi:hypothetical protein
MPQRDRPKPNKASQPGDDFRKIAGIGPVLAQRLWDAGILSYHDLGRHTPEEIAAVLTDMAGISPERIASQNWIGQASDLAGPPPEQSGPRQHYAAFHIEFLLDSDNSVRRSKVHHHQTDANDAWPGWDEERLLSFLRDRIPLAVAQRPADIAGAGPPLARAPSEPPATIPSNASQPPAAAPSESLPPSFLVIEELAPVRDSQISYIQHIDEPISVRLTLRIDPTDGPVGAAFECGVEISARKLGSHERLPVGTTHGSIRGNDPVSYELTGPPLSAGLYRLVAIVDIYPTSHSPQEPPLYSRTVFGDLLQVADAPAHLQPASEGL